MDIQTQSLQSAGKEIKKPLCNISGRSRDRFTLLGIASLALNSMGRRTTSSEMGVAVFSASSETEAINIMKRYVDFID